MENYDTLCRSAWLILGDRAAAEDAVADVLARFARQLPVAVDDPAAYAMRSVINAALQSSRSRRRRLIREIDHGPMRAEDQTGQIVTKLTVLRALADLTPQQRAAVTIVYLHERTYSEAASLLNCSVGTVKSQVSKGVARMRRMLLEES